MEMNLREKIDKDIPTLVEFINVNCEPCAMIEPVLQQVKNSIGKRVDIVVVNIQDVPEVAEKFSIQSVPMTILFDKGEILWKTTDVLSKQEIIEKVLDKIS